MQMRPTSAEVSATPMETAAEFCQRTVSGLKRKSDHNKREALWTFMAVIATTLATPIFVTLGPGILQSLHPSSTKSQDGNDHVAQLPSRQDAATNRLRGV